MTTEDTRDEPAAGRPAPEPAGGSGPQAWPAREPSRSVIWFGVVLIVASLVAAALVLWEMRVDAIEKAQTDLRRLALSQSQQTLAALKGADLALLTVINDLKNNPSSD